MLRFLSKPTLKGKKTSANRINVAHVGGEVTGGEIPNLNAVNYNNLSNVESDEESYQVVKGNNQMCKRYAN